MADVLLATDADWIYDDVDAALGGDHSVYRVRQGTDVPKAMLEVDPDVVVLDLQIGNMGGMATSLFVKQEAREARLPDAKVVMLLDRAVDDYLVTHSEADSWLVKPLDPFALQRVVRDLLANANESEELSQSSD
ncbi:MAG: hypothetical protein V3V01_08015 [Acidimicrobiales bacterium]